MLQGWVIVVTSFAYLGLLFAIAHYADKRADAGRSVIEPLHLQPVARGVRHRLDLLRQRRPRRATDRLPADLHRPDADDRAVVGGDAQDPAYQQGEPHHLARRLHRRATARARSSAVP